jgi:hypothetical protein
MVGHVGGGCLLVWKDEHVFVLVIWVPISLEDRMGATIDSRKTYISDNLSDRFEQEAEELRHKEHDSS